MSNIDDLQRRITAALDRIGQGLESLTAGDSGADSAELDALRQSLEEEKLANAQLEERLKALKRKQQAQQDAAEHAEAGRAETVRKLDAELQSLKKANHQLRENNKALREANASGVAEPHLINKAMLAELEGLRATRAAEKAEVDAVMADLSRVIDGAAGADDAKTEDA